MVGGENDQGQFLWHPAGLSSFPHNSANLSAYHSPFLQKFAAVFALALIFWLCIALVGYTYMVYPALLNRLARGKSFPAWPQPAAQPTVSVLIAAYNEAAGIGETLSRLLDSQYPTENLEIWVGNDASTDETAAIVASFDPSVKLVNFPGRTGKPQIINHLATLATGDIFVLTDATTLFEPETLPRLLLPYSDPAIGLTAGNLLDNGGISGAIARQEGAYLERETRMKVAQSLVWQLVIAPMGACYTLRRELYQPVPPRFNVDDFYISTLAQMQGKKAVLLPDARVYEDLTASMEHEFRRKVRVSKGNWQNLGRLWPALFRADALAFNFWSHKVLRWGTPFLILAVAACGIWLGLASGSAFWQGLLVAQLTAWACLPLDWLMARMGLTIKLLRYARYFVVMNTALLVGFAQWLKGVRGNTWEPTRK